MKLIDETEVTVSQFTLSNLAHLVHRLSTAQYLAGCGRVEAAHDL